MTTANHHTLPRPANPAGLGLLLVLMSALCIAPVMASEHEGERGEHHGRKGVALTPEYRAECGSCHVAYPPRMLSGKEWQQLMNNLNHHFGDNASLDAKQAATIGEYLQTNAGRQLFASVDDQPRITQTSHFKREHRKVPERMWSDPRVKSAANCTACHTGAEEGRYSERDIAIPELRGK